MSIQQSFSWWCFDNRGVDKLTLLRRAKAIGYDGVELMEPEDFELARSVGLKIVSHGAHASIDVGMNDRAEHDRIDAEICASLEMAQAFGIPNLIVFSGNRQPGVADIAGAECTAEILRKVAPSAEAAGVNLVMELLNSKVDHPLYQCDRVSWGIDVCKLVESPRVKLLYDIYHMQVMEGDLIRTIENGSSYFGHYHTAGNPGRHELDDCQEIQYPAVFRAIAATGYEGFIGHEFIPKADPVAALEHAYTLCVQSLEGS